MSRNVKELHRLIMRGPTTRDLQRWSSGSDLFTLYTADEETETSDFMMTIQEKVRNRQSIISPTEFHAVLQNYASLAKLNRRLMADDKEIWELNVALSALENVNNEILDLLFKLIRENALFFRYLKLPVSPFLKLYAERNDFNDDTLGSLIVSITLSSEYLLIAPPGDNKLIRVYQEEKSVDIELDQSKWSSLINRFNDTRNAYGYPSYVEHDD